MSEQKTEDTTYNGWKNYPTWAVNLWLANDEGLYHERRARARQVIADANEDEMVTKGYWTVAEAQRYRLADSLKQWVTDDLAPDLGASFGADLLGYALGEVDWHEIAASAIEDVQ
jgi:hypothetical protein